MSDGIRVNRSLVIPRDELRMRFSTSSGPGGQHVNRSSTRVDLTWNVKESRALGPRQRERILQGLGRRIDSAGVLHLSGDRHRSQLRNREDVEERLATLVADALRVRKARVATGPTPAQKAARIKAKRKRSDVKRMRARPQSDDDG